MNNTSMRLGRVFPRADAPADEATKGPASCIVVDPDGNPILLDQHV